MEAITAARSAPEGIATLIVPADVAWNEGGVVPKPGKVPAPSLARVAAIERAAAMLRSGLPTAIILNGNALYGKGLLAAGKVAGASGASLFTPYPFARLERGTGLPPVERTHYIQDQAIEQFKNFRQLILVGARIPRAYFAYPGKDSLLIQPETTVHVLAQPGEDYAGAFGALADALSANKNAAAQVQGAERLALPSGAITLTGLSAAVGATLPENTIVVDESMTSGRGLMAATKGAPPHDWLANTGGSIGIALPLAVGAAIAAPERNVLCLSADGSGMYTAQALWTMARESLKIVTVIFANRLYSVLKREFGGLGIGEPGAIASSMFEIGRPDLDWVKLAQGMGVPAKRVRSLDEFTNALQQGYEADGPTLIEVPL